MISNGWTSVGTAAVAIDGAHFNPTRMTIHNNDNSTGIYLGGTGVTTTNGLLLLKEQSYQFDLEPLEQIYAISTKEGHTISWMRQTI